MLHNEKFQVLFPKFNGLFGIINLKYNITASIGVATLNSNETQDSWLKRCDDYLYQAKSTGKNKVVFS